MTHNDDELRLLSSDTREIHEKMFKENPPMLDYEDLAILIGKMALEMATLKKLVPDVLNNTVEKKEDMFPALVGLLKKYKLIEKLHLKAINAEHKEGYTQYALMRIFIASVMGDIFATGLYEEDGKLKPALSFYMLYASCYKKFDNENFIFPVDFTEEFIILEKCVSNIKPYVDEPNLKKSLIHLKAEDFIQIVKVFIGAFEDMRDRLEVLEKENDTNKDVYPKVSFVDNALLFLYPFVHFHKQGKVSTHDPKK